MLDHVSLLGGTVPTDDFRNGDFRSVKSLARQHRSIAQEVTHLLTDALETPKLLSILDLKGLGKDHWREIDPSKHVQEERSSWD